MHATYLSDGRVSVTIDPGESFIGVPGPDVVLLTQQPGLRGWDEFVASGIPIAPAVPEVISDRQFGEGLWHDGLISFEDYIAFVGPGTIPAPLQAILDTLPDDDTGAPTPRKVAIGLVTGATEYRLSEPLVDVVRQAQGWTVEELHDHWRAWAAL